MSKHNETGLKGEQIAENFLLAKGYSILERNWRYEKKEIDIIAMRENVLVFVEVKTRTSTKHGFPEDAVGLKKRTFLQYAAEAYTIGLNLNHQLVQFDIISIVFSKNQPPEIVHFEDAFH